MKIKVEVEVPDKDRCNMYALSVGRCTYQMLFI